MSILSKLKKTVFKPPELSMWQERFQKARSAYSVQYDEMDDREALYKGTKKIDSQTKGVKAKKDATYTRNIIFELVESQIDSNIPYPKVITNCKHCQGLADVVEKSLKDDVTRLPFKELNDQQERTTPLQGGSYFFLEWDNTIKTHNTTGDVVISLLHPKQVTPQPGVTNIDQMDYIFVQFARTKEYIKRRYDVDVDDEDESNPEVNTLSEMVTNSEDKVTQIIAYYKNDKGGIGIFSWVNDTVLEDMEDYQARQLEVCTVCGKPRPYDSNECDCGNKKFKKGPVEEEEIFEDIVLEDKVIPAFTEKDGKMERTKIPYYKPNAFPIVLRKNVSAFGQLLGDSDTDKVRDQQMLINKLGTKIEEKLLKGGSFVTLPRGSNFRKDDSEFKVVEIRSANEAGLIGTHTIQPNISYDSAEKERAYIDAKSVLGITDTFQGKADNTAMSGKAKQIQVEQSAGRLESKRRMKNAAYQEVFKLIFQFKLAYADEPRPYMTKDVHGHTEYRTFNRYDFLEQDDAGEWYYNDNFLFEIDSAGDLANNRQSMWEETRMNYQQGTFGDPTLTETRVLFWSLMETLHYPMAGQIKEELEKLRQAEAEQAQMIQEAQMAPQAPVMPSNGITDEMIDDYKRMNRMPSMASQGGLDDLIQMLEAWDE